MAVAMAASLCGYKAHVVMPKGSLEVKKQGVIDLGAEISLCENYEQVSIVIWLVLIMMYIDYNIVTSNSCWWSNGFFEWERIIYFTC